MKNDNLQIMGSLPILHGLSLHIYMLKDGDVEGKILVGYSNETPRKLKLYHNSKGESYFRKHGKRYYLDDFMRGKW